MKTYRIIRELKPNNKFRYYIQIKKFGRWWRIVDWKRIDNPEKKGMFLHFRNMTLAEEWMNRNLQPCIRIKQ